MRSRLLPLRRKATRGPSWLLRRLLAHKCCRIVAKRVAPQEPDYRPASFRDAPSLARLYGYDRLPDITDPVREVEESIEGLAGRGHTLVADAGHGIAGAATLVHYEADGESLFLGWWIFGVIVRTRYRGRGIGEGLLNAALATAAEAGAQDVSLLVFEDNLAAIGLYRKLGFEPASVPGLDEQLEKEAQANHRRRIIMSRLITNLRHGSEL